MTRVTAPLLLGVLLAAVALWAPPAPGATPDAATVEQTKPPPSSALTTRSPAMYPPSAPTQVRVSILSGPASRERATHMAILLLEYRRRELEQKLGLDLEVANVSVLRQPPEGPNVIYYRPEFLRAALLLAEALPGEQSVKPMPAASLPKEGTDVEIRVGEPQAAHRTAKR